jgi:hypothetical protein
MRRVSHVGGGQPVNVNCSHVALGINQGRPGIEFVSMGVESDEADFDNTIHAWE